jgi:hypothetical protein
MTFFIQRRGQGYLATVDEVENLAEARRLLVEYCLADPSAHHFISRRACRAWKDRT